MKNLNIYDDFFTKKNFSLVDYSIKRKIYLRKLAIGELQGPMTDKPSENQIWLKYYTEDQLMTDMPKMSIYDYMMKKNKNNLNETALYYFGKKITYKKLEKLIFKCASSMQKNGVKKGDIVTICMPNTPEAVIAIYALNRIGAVSNMIHPLSSKNEIKDFLNEVNSKMIITIDSSCDKILEIADETALEKIIMVKPNDSMPLLSKIFYDLFLNKIKMKKNKKLQDWNSFLNESNNILIDNVYQENELAIILHTGGTTGVSKGVELTNDNFNSMVEQFLSPADDFERKDKMLAIMPVFHGFGLCSSIHLPLSTGVGVILIPKLNAKKFDKVLKKYKPNHIVGVPTLFKSMLKNSKLQKMDLSYLKYVVSGGDLVKDSLEEDINQFLKNHNSKAKLCKGYGLSEAVAGVTFADKNYNMPGSVGIPMVSTVVKIVKPVTNEELKEGEIGEICIQSPSVMDRYYKNQIETLEALKDEFLHTGDLGYTKDGIFYFSQRKANMIISSGVNVYPSNIEKVIEMHESVAVCAVIGVHHDYKIQVPKAYIVLKEGYEANEELKNEIENLCKQNLNKYSIPYSYEFRETLPQTLLGKISHRQLQEEEKVKIYTKGGK